MDDVRRRVVIRVIAVMPDIRPDADNSASAMKCPFHVAGLGVSKQVPGKPPTWATLKTVKQRSTGKLRISPVSVPASAKECCL